MCAHFRIASGFGLARLPPRSAGVSLRQDPVPDVEVAGDRRAGRVADGELRNLHQPRLDGVGQPEVAHDPREGPVRLLPDPAEEVGRRREVDAEVDAAQLVDAVEAVDPDGRLLEELLGVFLVLARTRSSSSSVRLVPPDAVGVVGLVVEDEDVLLAADLAAEDPVDQRRVALDVPHPTRREPS